MATKSFSKAELDELLDSYKVQEGFMGSVSLSMQGVPIHSYVSGYSDYESRTLSSAATKFRIGSVTKSFTAVLVMLAVEEGKLSLNETLEAFYPAIPNAKKITVEHMLRHRSGIRSYTSDPHFMQYAADGKTANQMIEIISSYPKGFEPGTEEDYSNSNTYLLTLILEMIYHESYDQLIESKICGPLGLESTYYAKELSASRGEAYSYDNRASVKRAEEFDHSVMLGAGGLVSTPTELVRFYDALFAGEILRQESLEKMVSMEGTFGLGLQKMTFAGKTSYGHRGHVEEFNAIVLHNPEEHITLAIADNSSFDGVPRIAKDILNALFPESTSITAEELEQFVGTYRSIHSQEEHTTVFERDENKLILVINGEFREELQYKGNNTFLFDQAYAPAITFIFSKDGKMFKHKPDSAYKYAKES